MSKPQDCTKRVSREDAQWWDWRDRAGVTKDASPLEVWNKLNETNLFWLHFVDGWAVVRDGKHGKTAFQGGLDARNGNEESSGDFLGFTGAALARMQTIPLEDELTAKQVAWIIEPVQEGVGREASCLSDVDVMVYGRQGLLGCFGGKFASCDHSYMNQTVLASIKAEMDPKVYDQERMVMHDADADRLPVLQRYLSEYYAKVSKKPSADATLDALVELAMRYARLHIFCDGNGRMRNLLLTRELVRAGFHPALMFDYNREMFHLSRELFKEELLEGLYMWEDAVRHRCVPWTTGAVQEHRQKTGPARVGLPDVCTAENWDALGGEWGCQSAAA
jgi:hypothetical protein